ncbi:phytanoyl-CoA dioxygenase family protein [Paenibacillus koleovorans]|uniref:phytanoyl-CoA dioxygenase family protein n=1 Tax=Paenibacillus koleovorans TaxID=121608 RepID=UPI000FDB5B8E|nr:phytanoyl-CoA dioxygenase family protein [Paenibacillus koleovorans]
MSTDSGIDLQQHLAQFKQDGYTIFKGVLTSDFMEQAKRKFADMQREVIIPGKRDWWFGNMCEYAPKLIFPAVSNPFLLDFAEMIMGPFVQIDNITLSGFPSDSKEEAKHRVSGWHRDRYAQVPRSDAYERPLSINMISYFQDMTTEYGPLRVIPGSHRNRTAFDMSYKFSPHPDEVVASVQAGDVIVTHNGLLHTGTPNTSGNTRFFFSQYYNLTWLRHTDNFSGPNISLLIEQARAANDHRTLRLFGIDEHLEQRCNSGFLIEDEVVWRRWMEEERKR